MELITGKDRAVTGVDGRLFHSRIHRLKKEYLWTSTKAGKGLNVELWDFLVQEVLLQGDKKCYNSAFVLRVH